MDMVNIINRLDKTEEKTKERRKEKANTLC